MKTFFGSTKLFRSTTRTFAFVMLIAPALAAYGQAYYCKQMALNVLRQIPKLKYDCREGESDYDEAILKYPERVSAIKRFTRTLETFNDPEWWAVSVDDLTYCDVHKKVGRLTAAERRILTAEIIFTSSSEIIR